MVSNLNYDSAVQTSYKAGNEIKNSRKAIHDADCGMIALLLPLMYWC